MNKKIYAAMNYHFNMGVAMEVGVEGAVMLNNLHYWIVKNMANKKHYHDGKYWTYNTLDAFVELFPCWTKRQIERILNNLKKDGYIETGNYNKISYDRTKWYTLTEKCWLLISPNCDIANFNISPNGDIENTKQGNENHDSVTPIPNHKPSLKPDINCSSKDELDKLWKLYPRKQGKSVAYKKMPKLIQQYGFEQIERCIKRYAKEIEDMHTEKKYIVIGSTFFNSRYEDYLDENFEEATAEEEKKGKAVKLII